MASCPRHERIRKRACRPQRKPFSFRSPRCKRFSPKVTLPRTLPSVCIRYQPGGYSNPLFCYQLGGYFQPVFFWQNKPFFITGLVATFNSLFRYRLGGYFQHPFSSPFASCLCLVPRASCLVPLPCGLYREVKIFGRPPLTDWLDTIKDDRTQRRNPAQHHAGAKQRQGSAKKPRKPGP